ncbi:MAG: ATP-binding domain-containing protein, partial [Bacilli bacterium]|nr:ATP-binding domain-containing protein [Bacilli bacterium]
VQEDATNLDLSDQKMLDYVFSYTEEAKILCAENEGIRGVKTINDYIKKKVIKKKEPVLSFQYPGQVMMINKNNKSLKLYNGDTGILVSIKNDDTIYFMVKKNSKLKDDYKKDEIFKIGQYLFYPLRLITLSEIDLSFAITVHKSQGSDYDHVLIILPTAKGHPLLNRQILYTAVTRTKGYTYIVSNKDSLNEAKERLITRDTNIIL